MCSRGSARRLLPHDARRRRAGLVAADGGAPDRRAAAARFTLEIQPDVASAVDYAVCATASLFVGNAYSAFSYLLREGALVRGAAERAGYYNLDASDGGGELGDITRREAVRWGVLPLGTRQLGAG